MQNERELLSYCKLGEWWVPISKTISPSCSSLGSYTNRERRAFLFDPIILLAFGMLGSCLLIFLVSGALSGGTSPYVILANYGDSPVLPECPQ